jgi:rhomboid protease GluP
MESPQPIASTTTPTPSSEPFDPEFDLADPTAPPNPPAGDHPSDAIRQRRRVALPWLTFVLIGFNLAVGIAALVIGGFQGQDNIAMLTFLGAKVGSLIQAGQYWRLITAGFLHLGVFHLLSNMLSLLFIGTVVEAFYGRTRYLMLYVLTGAAGMALSYLRQPELSVGASASVFGLVGVLVAHNWKYRQHLPPAILQRMSILVPLVVVQLAFGVFYPRIDQWAHVGGLVAGLLLGYLTESRVAGDLQNEREWLPLPAALATAVGLLAYAAIGWGFGMSRELPLAQGAMAQARGDNLRAARYYEEALKREPELGELRAQVAGMLQQQRPDEAQSQLKEMLRRGAGGAETETRYFQVLFNDAQRLSREQKAREAVARYREALPHAPDASRRALVQNNLAYVLADDLQQDYQEARDLAEAATTTEPDNGVYLDTLAWVYYRLGRLADAERVQQLALSRLTGGPLQRAITASPDEPVLRYHLAVILEAEGKKDAAVAEYQRTISTAQRIAQGDLQQYVSQAQEALERLVPRTENAKSRRQESSKGVR